MNENHQRKGETMETMTERLAALPEGHWLLISAPRIEHAITGTVCVVIMRDHTIKVVYEDGATEERNGTDALLGTMDADNPSLFALVGFVQDGRKAAK